MAEHKASPLQHDTLESQNDQLGSTSKNTTSSRRPALLNRDGSRQSKSTLSTKHTLPRTPSSPTTLTATSNRYAALPSVSLSPLTTRSSSSTRLNHHFDRSTILSYPADRAPKASPGLPHPTSPTTAVHLQHPSEAYRAWRRDSKERFDRHQSPSEARLSESHQDITTAESRQRRQRKLSSEVSTASPSSATNGNGIDDTITSSSVTEPTAERGRRASLKAKGANAAKAVSFSVGHPSSDSNDDAHEEGEASHSRDSSVVGPKSAQNKTGTGVDHFSQNGRGNDEGRESEDEPDEYTLEDVIQLQIVQPTCEMRTDNFDPLLTLGVGDYTFVLRDPSNADEAPSASAPSGTGPVKSPAEPTFHPDRVVLGKGKFSEVILVRKGDTEYALKHTPLFSHHPLIATRLLREPTILAQLLPHPNLVKVYETIRTPGHFYLVEENLVSSVTLEQCVANSPGEVLPLSLTWSVFDQLASVVHSLHDPLRVCHRDIKPENILVRETTSSDAAAEPTLILKLLDFGLATHYSASEPKLTTCCGSPAYHSPELWRGLREPSGTVRYWGPEVDIWCIGLTVLRCLTPNKYPLGIGHQSIKALSDKVTDALSEVQDQEMQQLLSNLLDMDGEKRIHSFRRICASRGLVAINNGIAPGRRDSSSPPQGYSELTTTLPHEASSTPVAPKPELIRKEFKSTSFIPTEPQHSLDLPLLTSTDTFDGTRPLEASAVDGDIMLVRSRSPSRSRAPPGRQTSTTTSKPKNTLDLSTCASLLAPEYHSRYTPTTGLKTSSSSTSVRISESFVSVHDPFPAPIELLLANPTGESINRVISYVKYALRCAGILYHVNDGIMLGPRTPSTTLAHGVSGNSTTGEKEDDAVCYLRCVARLPAVVSSSKASSALLAALRPPMNRAYTTGSTNLRSSSTPPSRSGQTGQPGSTPNSKKAPSVAPALTFYLSIRQVPEASFRHRSPSKRRTTARIRIQLSDKRAFTPVREALYHQSREHGLLQDDASSTSGHRERGRVGRSERRSLNADSLNVAGAATSRSQSLASSQRETSAPIQTGKSALGLVTGNIDGETDKRGFFDFVANLTRGSHSTAATPVAQG